jgi:hypothetical protein
MTKREALGTALVGVGMVGVMLPLVPGWPFLLAAVAVLGPNHRLTRPFNGLLQRGRSMVASGYARLGGTAAPPGRSGARRAAKPEAAGTPHAALAGASAPPPAKRSRGRTRAVSEDGSAQSSLGVKPPGRPAQRARRSGAAARLATGGGGRPDAIDGGPDSPGPVRESAARPRRRRAAAPNESIQS